MLHGQALHVHTTLHMQACMHACMRMPACAHASIGRLGCTRVHGCMLHGSLWHAHMLACSYVLAHACMSACYMVHDSMHIASVLIPASCHLVRSMLCHYTQYTTFTCHQCVVYQPRATRSWCHYTKYTTSPWWHCHHGYHGITSRVQACDSCDVSYMHDVTHI